MYEIQERMEEMATKYYRNYRQNKQFLMLKEEFSFSFRLAESNNSNQKSLSPFILLITMLISISTMEPFYVTDN